MLGGQPQDVYNPLRKASILIACPSPSYLNGIMMRDVLMDSLFWTIVMPWFLFLGLFLVPKQPSWLRSYAFPGVFMAIGLGLLASVAVGVGVFSIVLGLIAFAVCYEKPKASV